jgi:hypothetical protein
MEPSEIDALRMELGDRLGALEVKVDAVLASLEVIQAKLGVRTAPAKDRPALVRRSQ